MKKILIAILLSIFIIGCSNSKSENIKIIDMMMPEEKILEYIEINKQQMLQELSQHPDAAGVNFDDDESANKFLRSFLGQYQDTVFVDDESVNKFIRSLLGSHPMYGVVWFSPSTGEIAPYKPPSPNGAYLDYGRPNSSYIIWIEPGDSEFSIFKKFQFDKGSSYGIQYVGDGESIFNNSDNISLTNSWKNDLIEDNSSGPKKYQNTGSFKKLAENNSVFYISTPEGDCVIMIMDYYGIWPEGESKNGPTRTYNLRFKWKEIANN